MKRMTLILSCLIFSMGLTFAQTTGISGTVVDESGEPIIGSTIIVKDNSKIGTITDVNGKFELSVPKQNQFIIISYIGMKTQELEIKPVMNVKLQSDAKQLSEVVVTGIIKIDKRTQFY